MLIITRNRCCKLNVLYIRITIYILLVTGMHKLLIGTFLMFLSFSALSQETVLLNWNNGNGQTLDYWNWSDNLAFGNPGWELSTSKNNPTLGSGQSYLWGVGARSLNKGDYGRDNSAIIDTNNSAPGTVGGSLKVFETTGSTDHRSTWWVWYDGQPLSQRGITDSNTDRMSFYLKTEGMNPMPADNGSESISQNFHIGTYLCGGSGGQGQGDGCPYEGPGNQHYYHYLALNPGAWIHVLLDQHPQHLRDSSVVSNNPSFTTNGMNYFEHLMQFYMEIRFPSSQVTQYNLDELTFYNEPEQQNEESITSLWVGYWPNKDWFEIGFHDESFSTHNDTTWSTFEIRWSTQPITNANYNKATVVEPMFYSGVNYTGANDNLVRRPSSWKRPVWTRFTIPNVASMPVIYFAVKDVSASGQHTGAGYPWNRGDGHDAPTSNIKTINYSFGAKPLPPTGVSVKKP